MKWRIEVGDCREVMRTMPDASVDSIVTDPPYGLSFMGKGWDHGVPGVEFWVEALRVAKPGSHLLAFGGTRTYHRLACAIEDAGWEVRDCIAWVYGSGFPKSLDVSKAIDKINAEAGRMHKFTHWMRSTGVTAKQINDATGTAMGSHYLTAASQPQIPTPNLWEIIRPMCGDVPAWIDELVARVAADREVIGIRVGVNTQEQKIAAPVSAQGLQKSIMREFDITAPATDAARQWSGWGTALKPAFEPIIVARKPLVGTVAENVLKHGTGALNIDGCRVGTEGGTQKVGIIRGQVNGPRAGMSMGNAISYRCSISALDAGRWPANLIHDGSDEVVRLFPESTSGANPTRRVSGMGYHGAEGQETCNAPRGAESGSAARFFYCAKASRADRDAGLDGNSARANHHPTVKPTELMRYLCRLVTPPGGTVLDPFTGSGSTGRGAVIEGFDFIGIELGDDYADIARARIMDAALNGNEPDPDVADEPVDDAQLDLFGGAL